MDEIETEQEALKDLAFGVGRILQEGGHRDYDDISACLQDAEELTARLQSIANRLALEEESSEAFDQRMAAPTLLDSLEGHIDWSAEV